MNEATLKLYHKIEDLSHYCSGALDASEQPYDGILANIVDCLAECLEIINPENEGCLEIKLNVE